MNPTRAAARIYQETKQFTLDEQIERACHAASRVDAGYYFTDDELDNEKLLGAPHRPGDGAKTEWI
ncbi:hypothetical protein [Paraburkholderia tropica]|uniref:hypothetical protein n=1 Tax=Paraburkholderia tropica TaxID=92647 RepID=UPI002AB133D1|nr:hypothetical protein [Paraburkholderia tropica]